MTRQWPMRVVISAVFALCFAPNVATFAPPLLPAPQRSDGRLSTLSICRGAAAVTMREMHSSSTKLNPFDDAPNQRQLPRDATGLDVGSRRGFLRGSVGLSLFLLPLFSDDTAMASETTGPQSFPERMESSLFYSKWPYAAASDILPFIYATAKEGDVDSILDAMDLFGSYYPMYKLGSEKGKILEMELEALSTKPKVAVELGSFLGYSALRTARHLDEGGQMFCLEFNPYHAEVAQKVVKYGGLEKRVTFVVGKSTDSLPKIAPKCKAADFVLLDHAKDIYLSDLQLMEKLGVVTKGTLVAADNVIYPGAPGFLEYVEHEDLRRTGSPVQVVVLDPHAFNPVHAKRAEGKGGPYTTRRVGAKFEYDQKWKQGWTSKEDAISFSLRIQ